MPIGKYPRSLTQMQEDFCRYIVEGIEQKQAYTKAGYAGTALQVGWRASHMLRSKSIAARIAELRAPALAKTGVTVERIITELAKVAFFDIGNLFDEAGKMRPLHELTAEVRHGLRLEKGRISTHDKLAALDALTKIIGGYKQAEQAQQVENTQNNTLIIMDLRDTKLVGGQLVPIKAIEAP